MKSRGEKLVEEVVDAVAEPERILLEVGEDVGSEYPGQEILSWLVDEYEKHERGPVWYAVAIGLGFIMLVYSVVTQNFLFAVILLMFGVIMGLATLREPRKVDFVVTDLGIGLDGHFYPYKNLKNFWLMYEPPEVKNVYLEFKTSPRPHLVVPLDDQDPLEVRETLMRFMKEDPTRDEEPFTDVIGRLLKL